MAKSTIKNWLSGTSNKDINRLLAEIGEVIVLFDIPSRSIISASTDLLSLLGYSKKEVKDFNSFRSIKKLLHPDDFIIHENALGQLNKLKYGNTVDLTVRVKDATGGWQVCSIHGKVTEEDAKGIPCKLLILVHVAPEYGFKKEKEPKKSDALYTNVIDSMSLGFVLYEVRNNGKEFIFKDFNRGAEQIEGIKKENIIGKSLLKMFPMADEMGIIDVFKRVYKTGKAEKFPVSYNQDNKIKGWRENYIHKLPSGDIYSIYIDLTAEKEVNKAIERTEIKYQKIFRNFKHRIGVFDVKGNTKFINKVTPNARYQTEADVIGKKLYEYLPEDLGHAVHKKIINCAKSGLPINYEEQVDLGIDEGKKWQSVHIYKVLSKIKEDDEMHVIAYDITEKKEIEESLVLSEKIAEERFKSIAKIINESMNEIYIFHPITYKFLYTNLGAQKNLGYNYKELLELTAYNIKSKQTKKSLQLLFYPLMNDSTKSLSYRTKHLRKDGSEYSVETIVQKGNYESQDILFSIVNDITYKEQAELALKESEKKYRNLYENSPVPRISMDVNTDKAINANSRAIELAGYKSKEDFIQNYNANDHYRDISQRQELLNILKQGKQVNEEVQLLRKDGSMFWGLLNMKIVDGIAESSLVDITQLKLIELQLKNSLEEKEILLREIHHRVKNNLQVVWGLIDLQQRKLVDKKLKAALADSKQRINTMALIHETLYKGDSLEHVQMENYTSKLIQDYKELYASDKISPVIVLKSDDFTVDLDRAVPIGLIINELVSNAYKHAFKNKKNGTINIEQRSKKGYVHIFVSDNGTGFDFDFNKSSESIGLRLVSRLCMQLEAKLDVESKKNKGTSYHVYFKN